ncbi:hypothetical protein Q0M94_28375 (plasmid) [Deinococcus radiomollis]|uniref:hypothetical protein n=1 Tax=Deinococcus radiomollis TaxID=468916 RepID=UPI0038921912
MTGPATERQVEAAVVDLFLRAGWHSVKTDAALVIRGGRRRGSIQAGFPDRVFLLGLGAEALLTLACVVELKTDSGQLSPDQIDMHNHLRDHYRIHPHVIRSAEQAVHLIRAGQVLQARLKEVL